jgi:hypothetical protein
MAGKELGFSLKIYDQEGLQTEFPCGIPREKRKEGLANEAVAKI